VIISTEVRDDEEAGTAPAEQRWKRRGQSLPAG
jgi:hypothetical protein